MANEFFEDDKPGVGHNNPPAKLLESDPVAIGNQLKLDHAELVQKQAEIIMGAVRFVAQFGGVPVVDDLPPSAKAGDVLLLTVPGVNGGAPVRSFTRFLGGKWQDMPDDMAVAMLLPHATLPNKGIAEKVTTFGRQIKDLDKLIEKAREEAKQPYDQGSKAVQKFFKAQMQDPLTAILAGLNACMTTYQNELARQERETRMAEAKRLKDEADAAAALARQTLDDTAIDKAVEVAAKAEKAEARAVAPVAEMGRVSGVRGGTSAVLTVWSWEVEDEEKIPREYFVLDRARIDREVRAQKGEFKAPGIKVTSSSKASIR